MPAQAQWMQIPGLGNRNVACLAVLDSMLYAGTGDGVFRSSDTGATWDSVSTGLADLRVSHFSVRDGKIYAATVDSGIFSASLNDPAWIPMGLKGRSVSALWVGSSEMYAGTVLGTYSRTLADTSWIRLGIFAVYSLAGDDAFLFQGVGNGIVRFNRTADTSELVLRTSTSNTHIGPLWLQDSLLLTGSNGQGFYRSTDYGKVWNYFSSHSLSRVNSFAASGTILFGGVSGAGVWRSADRGATWTAFNTGLQNRNVTCLAAIDSILFAGTSDGGVWRYRLNVPVGLRESRDGGLSSRLPRWEGRAIRPFDLLGRKWEWPASHSPDFPRAEMSAAGH
jgi:hypothetical protein